MNFNKFLIIPWMILLIISGCTVRQQDLDAWVGVPVGALDTHPFFNTIPMDRTITDSGIEIRNYRNARGNVVCNNIFYIKGRKVIKYAPTGRCRTFKGVQPQYLAEDRFNDINKRQQFCDADDLNKAKIIDTVEAYKQFLLECNDPGNQYYKLANQRLSLKLTPKKIESKVVAEKKVKTEFGQAVVLPIGVLGKISESKKIIFQNKFMEVVSNDYDLVSQEEYQRAEEEAFQELDYEECTEDQCIKMIQEILQVENMYKIQLIKDENDIQVSLTYIDLDKKLVQTDFCENCKTSSLIKMINKLYLDLGKKR